MPPAFSNVRTSEAAGSTAVVTKTREPMVIGEDQPRPGTGAFQARLVDSLQFCGKALSSGTCTVELIGCPRNWGESSASPAPQIKQTKVRLAKARAERKIMGCLLS